MRKSGNRQRHGSTTISSDSDLREYLQDQMRGANTEFDRSPVLEYASERDFLVEPLETDAAAFLVNVFLDDTSAETRGDQRIACWAPATNEALLSLQERLSKWGYDISGIQRTNRSINLTPVMECTAHRSPSALDQFRVLSELAPSVSALLDGWAVVVQNRHRLPKDNVDIEEWAGIRDVPSDEIQGNINALGDALRENGGIPGTQWAIQEAGGIAVTQD